MPYSVQTHFHLYGDLWLEDPKLSLSHDDLVKLEGLQPYLHQLDTHREGTSFLHVVYLGRLRY